MYVQDVHLSEQHTWAMTGNHWTMVSARHNLADLVKGVSQAPQTIFNRNTPVAVVIDPVTFEAFEAWRAQRQMATVADAFAELRDISRQEKYQFEPVRRVDRANPFLRAPR